MKNILQAGLVAIFAVFVLTCAEMSPVEVVLDGSTPERAVSLGGIETSFEAVALEEEWIEINYGGAEVVQQDLIELDGRLLDKLTLKMPDGSIRALYFDLTLTGD